MAVDHLEFYIHFIVRTKKLSNGKGDPSACYYSLLFISPVHLFPLDCSDMPHLLHMEDFSKTQVSAWR